MENPKKNPKNNKAIGCIVILTIIIGSLIYFSNNSDETKSDSSTDDINACLMSEDFIKKNLNYPNEAEFPFLDCHSTDNGDGTYTILRKITAKNAFGVESSYIYKLEIKFNGGLSEDENNWELISMKSEKSQ